MQINHQAHRGDFSSTFSENLAPNCNLSLSKSPTQSLLQMYVKILTLDIKKKKFTHMPMCLGIKELEIWLQLSEKLPDSMGPFIYFFLNV